MKVTIKKGERRSWTTPSPSSSRSSFQVPFGLLCWNSHLLKRQAPCYLREVPSGWVMTDTMNQKLPVSSPLSNAINISAKMGLNLLPCPLRVTVKCGPAAGAGETQEVGGDPLGHPHGLLFTKQRPILFLLGLIQVAGQPTHAGLSEVSALSHPSSIIWCSWTTDRHSKPYHHSSVLRKHWEISLPFSSTKIFYLNVAQRQFTSQELKF